MKTGDIVLLGVLVILIALSAFFSATETAFSSLNKIRMKNYSAAGNKKAACALKVAEHFDKALSAILIGNNVVNIASASIGTLLFTNWIGPAGVGVSTAVMTILVLIFGEILPKSYAKGNAEHMALQVASILSFLMKLLSPLIFIFSSINRVAAKFYNKHGNSPTMTEEELKVMIDEIEDEGVLEEQERVLVRSALDFDETSVEEILTPRVDVVAVNITATAKEIYDIFCQNGFSRLPVYKKNIDNIVGIIHQRDFFVQYTRNQKLNPTHLIQKILFVPQNLKISLLLRKFQNSKIQFAVVADQYGGTLGIVTMEDIVEELVGEIWDEHDSVSDYLVQEADGSYIVLGEMNIYDFFEQIDYDTRNFETESNSVSGWALEQLGKIPAQGESFDFDCFHVEILEVEEQRIKKLLIQRKKIQA